MDALVKRVRDARRAQPTRAPTTDQSAHKSGANIYIAFVPWVLVSVITQQDS
jgi:hypothetical protein